MSDVEVRRIQRVGSSSLVVTLPKAWARRLGLEQGSTVVLYEEGDSIRIVPAVRRENTSLRVDLSRMPPLMAISVPVCSYLAGLDRVEVSLPQNARVEDVKMRGLVFMGMHIYEVGDNKVVIETLLDMDRIDPDSFIKSLGTVAERLVQGLIDAVSNGGDVEALNLAGFARQDFMRTLYVVLRSLFTRTPARHGRRDLTLKLMSASYVSLAIEILYSMITLIPQLASSAPLSDKKLIIERLRRLGQSINMLLHVIPSPSAKRLSELIQTLHKEEDEIKDALHRASSPITGALIGKIQDATRIVTLASYITVCRLIVALASGRD